MDNLSGKLSIDTPENIVIDAEIAGFGTRCIAAIIDYMILLVVFFFMALLFSSALSREEQQSSTVLALYALVQFIIITFYHLIFELIWNGQTPGKRRTNIRVVQTNGLPLSTSGALIRNLVRLF
ncbi:MAG: RDD family protein, partial [Anaerolineae bacterium]|nr:RDD family protein [Anaerolineae bacterium]